MNIKLPDQFQITMNQETLELILQGLYELPMRVAEKPVANIKSQVSQLIQEINQSPKKVQMEKKKDTEPEQNKE